jgi:SAM-dependent methyltransferase
MSSLWAWNISALFYARTYGPLAHALDDDVLRHLGPDGVRGKVVLDAGCGPGVVARKLAAAGAAKVICADVAAGMLEQLGEHPALLPVQTALVSGTLRTLAAEHAPEGVDLVLFKRSLYHPSPEAEAILRDALSILRPGGRVVVVHPERSLVPYAFGRPARLRRHTPYHLFNRTISRLGVALGGEQYTLYTQGELLALAHKVASRVQPIPSAQHAFNLVALG